MKKHSKEECILCGSTRDTNTDHVRTAYLTKDNELLSGYYTPLLTSDEKYKIKKANGYGEFNICTNRPRCRRVQVRLQAKKYTDCYTTEDWIEYFYDASKSELRSVLKDLGKGHLSRTENNKRDAINALLY